MKHFLFLFVAALLTAMPASAANARITGPGSGTDVPDEVDFSVLPSNLEDLGQLDERHRILIQQAMRRCEGEREPGATFDRECVARDVNRQLGRLNDPQMRAFHHALPESARFNQARSEMEWQPAVKARIAQTTPLDWESPAEEKRR